MTECRIWKYRCHDVAVRQYAAARGVRIFPGSEVSEAEPTALRLHVPRSAESVSAFEASPVTIVRGFTFRQLDEDQRPLRPNAGVNATERKVVVGTGWTSLPQLWAPPMAPTLGSTASTETTPTPSPSLSGYRCIVCSTSAWFESKEVSVNSPLRCEEHADMAQAEQAVSACREGYTFESLHRVWLERLQMHELSKLDHIMQQAKEVQDQLLAGVRMVRAVGA
ncbi:hypothetical protein AK812_SmicGene741 [Symbiodinium microadriaticum]|uniref:Uncharacterized protein n=1 Tax=Symbiodinium microadriaticum TaxID=2951 RepID=A0A1Q9F647_SYMMI|nr:hypothetical protein AK812_SmicGene741 [Symbiodinium microadriaticum]